MTYLATPQHKDPCSGGHEIYNLGRPLLGYHYYTLGVYSGEKYLNFTLIFFNRNSSFVVGHEIYDFFSHYLTDITYQIW